jgi:cytochrome b
MNDNTPSVRIWDLPTRLFHWAFAACIAGAFVTVKLGGLYMEWHVRFGLTALGLVAFRLIWGCIGPRYARFRQFVRGPAAIRAYLRQPAAWAGHNPLGALSVLALLADLGLQAVTGLFSNDDIMVQGPLYSRVSESLAGTLTYIHKSNEFAILALVALHVLAVAWHTWGKRHPLTRAMITGDMAAGLLPADTLSAEDGAAARARALILAAVIAGGVWWLGSL